jgi:23S rRNA pseudouridine1911/1915/1917 synthase
MPDLSFIMHWDEPAQAERYLRRECGLSHRQISRLKQIEGGMTVNGQRLRSVDTVCPGDVIRLHLVDTPNIVPNPALYVPVAFEDEDVRFFDKPAGMPIHPSHGHREDTLGNAFAAMFPAETFRPVNRLDANTSGLTAAAKHAIAAAQLPERIRKTYLAVVTGTPPDEGTIDAPLGRTEESIIVRCIRPDGQPAVTHFRTLRRGTKYTLVELHLETGRTHQIRVHMASIGCPLAGDSLYGGDLSDIPRHALHCCAADYTDLNGQLHHITSGLPEDMQRLIG